MVGVFRLAVQLAVRAAQRDSDPEAATEDFDPAQVRPGAPSEAVGADPAGASCHFTQDPVRAERARHVTFDAMSLGHPDQGTPLPTLEELSARIQAEVDAFALTIGLHMDRARRRSARRYARWVQDDTPFTLAEAERLRAIAIAYRDLPTEATTGLPRPSSALSYVLEYADTTPYLSATREFSREDIAAGALLGGHPENLSSDVKERLARWLGQTGDGLGSGVEDGEDPQVGEGPVDE